MVLKMVNVQPGYGIYLLVLIEGGVIGVWGVKMYYWFGATRGTCTISGRWF